MKEIKMWWYRNFCVISTEKAKKLGLIFWRNVYGSEIKRRNCGSIYFDHKRREYRIKELNPIT